MQVIVKIIKLAQRLLTDVKVMAAAKIERARILRNIPIFQKSQYTRKLENINANCNAAHLAEYILHPSYTQDPFTVIFVKQQMNVVLRL